MGVLASLYSVEPRFTVGGYQSQYPHLPESSSGERASQSENKVSPENHSGHCVPSVVYECSSASGSFGIPKTKFDREDPVSMQHITLPTDIGIENHYLLRGGAEDSLDDVVSTHEVDHVSNPMHTKGTLPKKVSVLSLQSDSDDHPLLSLESSVQYKDSSKDNPPTQDTLLIFNEVLAYTSNESIVMEPRSSRKSTPDCISAASSISSIEFATLRPEANSSPFSSPRSYNNIAENITCEPYSQRTTTPSEDDSLIHREECRSPNNSPTGKAVVGIVELITIKQSMIREGWPSSHRQSVAPMENNNELSELAIGTFNFDEQDGINPVISASLHTTHSTTGNELTDNEKIEDQESQRESKPADTTLVNNVPTTQLKYSPCLWNNDYENKTSLGNESAKEVTTPTVVDPKMGNSSLALGTSIRQGSPVHPTLSKPGNRRARSPLELNLSPQPSPAPSSERKAGNVGSPMPLTPLSTRRLSGEANALKINHSTSMLPFSLIPDIVEQI